MDTNANKQVSECCGEEIIWLTCDAEECDTDCGNGYGHQYAICPECGDEQSPIETC